MQYLFENSISSEKELSFDLVHVSVIINYMKNIFINIVAIKILNEKVLEGILI